MGGQFDEATVVINMEDIDNLNPYFKHNLYRASIPENEVSLWTPLVKTLRCFVKMMSNCIKGSECECNICWIAAIQKVKVWK